MMNQSRRHRFLTILFISTLAVLQIATFSRADDDAATIDSHIEGLQNLPELNSATIGSTVVNGRLYSIYGQTFRIQVFAHNTCEPSDDGEEQTLLGETSVTINQDGVGLFTVTVPPLQEGQYLTATASSNLATSALSPCVEVVAGPSAPTLVNPPANGTISNARPGLSWNPVKDAQRYHIQVAANVDFSALIADTLEASTVSAPAMLLPGYYYWRVQVETTAGVWSNYSEIRSFGYAIMKAPLPGRPVYSHQPQFSWNAYPQAQRYQLQVDNNLDFSSIEAECDFSHRVLRSGPCDVPGGLAFGDYYWRVNIDLGNGFIISPIAWPVTLMVRT